MVDRLKVFPEAGSAVFPQAEIQSCIVHLLRYSVRFASWKERQALGRALKSIYQAATAAEPRERPQEFSEDPWGQRYPMIRQSWEKNWEQVIPFFPFPPEVRRMIYTTNATESLNGLVRGAVRARGHFPRDDVPTKLIWMVLRNDQEKWAMPPNSWYKAISQFAIHFQDRFIVSP